MKFYSRVVQVNEYGKSNSGTAKYSEKSKIEK